MESKESVYRSLTEWDHEDSRSSTDVDVSLVGDGKQWHSTGLETSRRRKASKVTSAFRSYFWLVETFLLLVIIGLLLMLRYEWKEHTPSSMQVGGDFTGAGPHFATKVVKWQSEPAFVPVDTEEFFSNKTREVWNGMMPVGTGWGSEDTFFTTTMTHQLHCVFMMGRIYSGVLANKTDTLPHDFHTHYLHCVDYLRQAIMCSGDVALEPHAPTDSDDNGAFDGSWNGHHVCKDYSQVIGYLEDQIKDGIRVVLPIDD